MSAAVTIGRQREFVAQFAAPLRPCVQTETRGASLLLLAKLHPARTAAREGGR